jgi:hypothetical protein
MLNKRLGDFFGTHDGCKFYVLVMVFAIKVCWCVVGQQERLCADFNHYL